MKNHENPIIGNRIIPGSQPFFSIIIATYNRARLVTRAVKSLISQTEQDWEAIIIDDGSTDNTYSEIFPILHEDSRIKYIRRNHCGESISKNAGINTSSGRYISFLDSDDEYHACHLASRKFILMNNPHVRFLYGGVKILGNQSVPDRFNNWVSINLNKCVIGGTFFIERNLLISLKGFSNISYGTDSDLFDRIKEINQEIIETRLPTYIYHRESDDSITNRLLMEMKPSGELRNISQI